MAQYRLLGSLTSPYVRRLRLFIGDAPCDFEPVADMYGKDDQKVSALNPLKRVPVLLVDGRPLFESRVIYNHLCKALGRRALDLDDENALSVVDTVQDQLIQTFLMKKFAHPIDNENDYFKRHADRRVRMLNYLRAEVIAGRFDRWDYPAMSLLSLIDWAMFRSTLTAEELSGPLAKFLEQGRRHPLVEATDPRKG